MAFLSTYLSLKTDDSALGRYWIANETIPTGTLLVKELPIVSITNCQITNNEIIDPINNKNHSFCWSCCSLFASNVSNASNHYCSNECKSESAKIMDIVLNPSLSFNKSIQNDSTLRLTLFMILKTIHTDDDNENKKEPNQLLFTQFTKTPSKFYQIFTNKNVIKNNKKLRLLQYKISNKISNNALYQSYLNKLSQIMPKLLQYLSTNVSIALSSDNLYKLSVNCLNMIFINGFGIRYSLVHDDNMLGLALFYNSSFFNHSCSANAFYYFLNGNQIIIRTLREIKKNEAITISIVNDLESHSKQQRQSMLLQNFGFNCLCLRCTNEEYINNNQLLAQRMNETDCVFNHKQHINLLNYARTNWRKSTNQSIAWKFYAKLFSQYEYYYHPFDPDMLSLLQEIAQKAFMSADYNIGYDASELGRQFCTRLTSSNIVEQCHLTEFKFIFLSFLNYLHLVRDKYPNQQIEEIINPKTDIIHINDMKQAHNDKVADNDVIVMNDDVLLKMFEDECKVETVGNVKKKDRNKNNRKHNKNKKNKKGNKNKRKHSKGNKNKKKGNEKISKDKNVKVYRFDNDIYDECDEKVFDFEMKDDEEDEMQNSLQYELNEKIIELFATRSILFPKFADFEQWIGNDLLLLDSRIQNVVTSLKGIFDEND